MPIPVWSYPLIAAGTTAVCGTVARHALRRRERPALPTLWLHSINDDLCVGCGNCVDVCPRDVLRLEYHKSRVERFDACIQCRECESACPTQALRMHPQGTEPAELDVPVLSEYYETAVPGMYLIGEAAMVQFVKNAVNLGCAVVEHMVRLGGLIPLAMGQPPVDEGVDAAVDVLIVGAGPGGLSAALTCVVRGLSYVLIERGDTALATVMSYPPGKQLHAMPPEVECLGPLPVRKDFYKEELMAEWNPLAAATAPQLLRQTGVESVQRQTDGWFLVQTDRKLRFRAQRVVLAVGGGTPRGAGELPGAELRHVRVGLDDASRYSKQVALVLGGGNVAVEAAVHLAAPQLGNRVILAYRDKRHKLKANSQNREALTRLEAENRVLVECQATVEEFQRRTTLLNRKSRGKKELIPTSAVFVCYGKEPAHKWLSQLGVTYKKLPHRAFARPPTDELVRRLLKLRLPARTPGPPALSDEESAPTMIELVWRQQQELGSATEAVVAEPTPLAGLVPMAYDGAPQPTITMIRYPMQRLEKAKIEKPALSVAELRLATKGTRAPDKK